jgi:hypothetical protein
MPAFIQKSRREMKRRLVLDEVWLKLSGVLLLSMESSCLN